MNSLDQTDLQLLLDVLPDAIRQALEDLGPGPLNTLIEVVMDLGRSPEARFLDGRIEVLLPEAAVSAEDLVHVTARIGPFSSDNRSGIPRTLHRISALRNRTGAIVGLTCRVGRLLLGTIAPLEDLIEEIDRSGKSLLLLGPPGVGKTTRLREFAKRLADDHEKRVLIVDTSNEIAGDGDIPHPAVGRARRIQVERPERQKDVMIEAVQNHTPQVIVVDEIGTEDEAMAARTIAERGVSLIGTAHGATLENLVKNPMLSDLLGGVQSVTLGDEEAKRRSTQKTVLEREKKPTFDMAIELRDHNTLAIYPDVAEAVDHLLRGWSLFPEVRKVTSDGEVKILKPEAEAMPNQPPSLANLPHRLEPNGGQLSPHQGLTTPSELPPPADAFPLFLYGVNPATVQRLLERVRLMQVRIVGNVHLSRAILTLREIARPGSQIAQVARDYDIPLITVKNNSLPQLQRGLRELLRLATPNPQQPGSAPSPNDAALGTDEDDDTDLEDDNEMTQTDSDQERRGPRRRREDGPRERREPEPVDQKEVDAALAEAKEAVAKVLKGETVELAPRRSYVRRLQHEYVSEHGQQVSSFSLGNEPNRRLCLFPPPGA